MATLYRLTATAIGIAVAMAASSEGKGAELLVKTVVESTNSSECIAVNESSKALADDVELELVKPVPTAETNTTLVTKPTNRLSDAALKLKQASVFIYNSTDMRTISLAIAAGCAGAYRAPANFAKAKLGGYYYHYMEDCIALAAAGVFDPKVMVLGVAGFSFLWEHGIHSRDVGQLWLIKQTMGWIWTVAPTVFNVLKSLGRTISRFFDPKQAAQAAEAASQAAREMAKEAAKEVAREAVKERAVEVVKQAATEATAEALTSVAKEASTGLLTAAAEGVTKGAVQALTVKAMATGMDYASKAVLPLGAEEATLLLTNDVTSNSGIFATAAYYAGSAVTASYKTMNAANRFLFNRRRF